jgi:hypothetical protein
MTFTPLTKTAAADIARSTGARRMARLTTGRTGRMEQAR